MNIKIALLISTVIHIVIFFPGNDVKKVTTEVLTHDFKVQLMYNDNDGLSEMDRFIRDVAPEIFEAEQDAIFDLPICNLKRII